MLKDSEVEIGDYFRSNLLTVRKAMSQEDFKRFANLSTNADRVAFVLGYPEAHHLPVEVENLEFKNGEKALKLKNLGNKLFAQGEFKRALETYSNAVLLAPQNELAVTLANRSAALYHLGQHEHCIEDIEEALKAGYPKELHYKVEERRARCLLALKRHPKAMEAFRSALKSLDHAKVPAEKKGKLESDIRVMLAVMERGEKLNKSNKKQSVNKVATKENARNSGRPSIPEIARANRSYPACSDAVEIRDEGGDVGRHGVATRHIYPGEVLIVERPHCALLLAEYRLSHCHLCFSRVFVPMPAACNVCSCVVYCSSRCRDEDSEVHLRECGLLPALWLSNASVTCFLALRAIVQRPLREILRMREKLSSSRGEQKKNFEETPYNGADYENFYNLVTHEDRRPAEDIFHRAYIAAWLLRLLKTSSYIPENERTPDNEEETLSSTELFLAGLLLHNLQLLQFNSHEISELVKPARDKTLAHSKSLFIGGGVYPTVALLNHSCNPGVVRYFVGTTMIVRAVRSIEKGEEISENYGPMFTTVPEAERKRTLRLQYWFDCGCEACTGHWPLLEDIDQTILRFKCETGPSCGNILPVRIDTNNFMYACPKCGKNTNILMGLKALQDTDILFKSASRNLEEGRHEEALRFYVDILKRLDETLALPMRDYHVCQQGIRLCVLALGNFATT